MPRRAKPAAACTKRSFASLGMTNREKAHKERCLAAQRSRYKTIRRRYPARLEKPQSAVKLPASAQRKRATRKNLRTRHFAERDHPCSGRIVRNRSGHGVCVNKITNRRKFLRNPDSFLYFCTVERLALTPEGGRRNGRESPLRPPARQKDKTHKIKIHRWLISSTRNRSP